MFTGVGCSRVIGVLVFYLKGLLTMDIIALVLEWTVIVFGLLV